MNKNRLTDILNSDTSRPSNGHTMMTQGFAIAANSTQDRDATFTAEKVAATNAQVTASGVLDLLTAWRSEDSNAWGRRRGGLSDGKATSRPGTRPGLVSDRAILVGLLLLAAEDSPLHISALAGVFQNRLSVESGVLLGLPSWTAIENGISRNGWYERTRRAFHRMLAPVDPFPQVRQHALTYSEIKATLDDHDIDLEQKMKARLDEFTKVFLRMTHMQQPQHIRDASNRISLSIGQTFIPSPTPTGFSWKNLHTKVRGELANPRTATAKPVDVFAGWYPRGLRNGRPTLAWGWAANIAVRANFEVPAIVVSATMSMPGARISEEAVSLMRAALELGLAPGVVDADMAYFGNAKTERLHKPTAELGFTPSTDYRRERLGVQGGKEGAEFIEGKIYCPGMPDMLKHASVDHRNGIIDEQTYRARIQQRVQFEFRPKGKPDSNGRIRMACPSAGASPTVTCPLRKLPEGAADKNRGHVWSEDLPTFIGSVCTQQTVTFNTEDNLRQRQAFTYGSPDWFAFRSHARSAFDTMNTRINNETNENVGHSSRRDVHGFAAAQVFLTIVLTDYNLRAVSDFLNDQIGAA